MEFGYHVYLDDSSWELMLVAEDGEIEDSALVEAVGVDVDSVRFDDSDLIDESAFIDESTIVQTSESGNDSDLEKLGTWMRNEIDEFLAKYAEKNL